MRPRGDAHTYASFIRNINTHYEQKQNYILYTLSNTLYSSCCLSY